MGELPTIARIRVMSHDEPMPVLLHEYWEDEDGGEFCPVRQDNDRIRPILTPNARKIFEIRASSWFEAMRLHNEQLGYGEYTPADGVADHVYTDEEALVQEAYLQGRNAGSPS